MAEEVYSLEQITDWKSHLKGFAKTPRTRFSKKQVVEAMIDEIEEAHGWEVIAGGGHCWGKLRCPLNDSACRNGNFCSNSVWSTPKSPQNHAKKIRKWVNGCMHTEED